MENTEPNKNDHTCKKEIAHFSEKIWSMFAKEKPEDCVDPDIAVPACGDAFCKICVGCKMDAIEFYGLLEDMRTFFDQIRKDLKEQKE